MERKSNFELLRIVLIFMVITLHYLNARMGGALSPENIPSSNFNYFISRLIESFSIVAVNCFILITGYFMYKKKEVDKSKILDLVVIYLFYLFLIGGLTIIFEPNLFSIEKLESSLLFNGGAWFIIIYSILYFLIPYINIVIEHIDKRKHFILLIILLFFFSFYPTFISNVTVNDSGYGIINFITLYLIGAFVSKYKLNKNSALLYFIIYVFTSFITFFNFLDNDYYNTLAYNSIFNIIGSIALFLFFSKLNIKSKLINKMSKYVFSIYIIHINPFIKSYIWTDIMNSGDYYTSNFFIVNLVISVTLVFIGSLFIDIFRDKLFIKLKNMNNKL